MRWLIVLFCICCQCEAGFTDFFVSKTKTLRVETTSTTNDRTPVYLLVKATDFSHFLLDDYQTIAALVAKPDEEGYLASLCLIPGTTKTLTIEETEQPIAFYALFTKPSEGWKYLLNTEESFKKIEVVLGEHEIKSVKVSG